MGLLEQWSVYTIYWYVSDFLKPPQVAQVVKNSPAKAGDVRNAGSTPGSGRSLGEGNGNPFQYSCPENPMDRGGWWATVHVVTTQLRDKHLYRNIILYHWGKLEDGYTGPLCTTFVTSYESIII